MNARQRWVAGLLASMCLCGALAARASNLSRDGLGPIPTGRGGVNQAFSDNAEMIVDNPSSMVNVEGDGLIEIGVATAIATSNYADAYGNDVNSKVRPLPGPVLGITKKLPGGQWAIGIGLFAPESFGASYGVLNDPNFGPGLTRSQGALIKLLPAVAYRASERLSLGASLGVGMSYASFNGPQYIQSGTLVGTPILLDAEGTGVTPVGALGLQYQLTEHTRFGATYTEQASFWMHGATSATLLDGGPIESRFNSKIRLRWPRNIAMGLKHDLCPHRRFAVDLVWTDWSSAFRDINVVMYDPSNPAIQSLISGAGGSLPLNQKMPLEWHDTVAFRFGYEADLTDNDVLRFGYDYQPSPTSTAWFNPFVTAGRQHVFSLGFSHKLKHLQRAIFNAAYQYSHGSTSHVDNSALAGGQYDGATYQSDAHYATMSLSIPY